MRTPFIAGNWKMNKTVDEAVEFASLLRDTVADVEGVDIAVCPPFPALGAVAGALKGSNIRVGAQNLHWEEKGAFTGEVSADMILSAGCTYVIIGHSERRQYFGETDETVNKKVKKALEKGLVPIVCVGETIEQRKAGEAERTVRDQLEGGLKDLSVEGEKLVVAYEPVWAIGTGETATPETAQQMHAFIREVLAGLLPAGEAEKVRIQYGGSVKPGNVKDIMAQPDVDGALVGGASLAVDSFTAIVRFREA